MKNVSTGFGLYVLGLGIAAWPVLDRLVPTADASAVPAAAAVSAASFGQAGPSIVWYGTDTVYQVLNSESYSCSTIWRAWSDGKIEAMTTRRKVNGYNSSYFDQWCTGSGFCTTGWTVVSSSAQGLTYRSDINFDEKVDGADLGQLLADWGIAPRQDIPPSDCPLALINP